MSDHNLNVSGVVGGVSISGAITRTIDGQISSSPINIAAAVAGTIDSYAEGPPEEWVCTCTGHSFIATNKVDVYWSGGRRYGMIVNDVDGETIDLQEDTVVGGDDMPAAETAITVCLRQEIDVDFDGDLLEMLAVICTAIGWLVFEEVAPALAYAVELPAANEPFIWAIGGSIANPLAGKDVVKAYASHAETTAKVMGLGIAYDNTV